jgi:hypothetical protein
MGILNDLTPPVKTWPCLVRETANKLEDPADKNILLEAVMDDNWKFAALERVLRDKGISLGQQTIKKHREKNCSCWKQNLA